MFWPAPEDSSCISEVHDSPRHFSVTNSEDMMVFLHNEEAEDEVFTCSEPAIMSSTPETVRRPASVVKVRFCHHEAGLNKMATHNMWTRQNPDPY